MSDDMFAAPISRRQLLKTVSCGFGYLALADLAARAATESNNALAPKRRTSSHARSA